MARKAKQRISYVLPLANETHGHRLGVNGLAVDENSSILYSGGRDGVICAWDLHLDLQNNPFTQDENLIDANPPPPPATTCRRQVQAHTHWINDIALAHSNRALVSASSDITVKVWRPAAEDRLPPQSIGLHSDYVKTLAVPTAHSDWVASGGLDRRICLWDLNGGGQKLSIDVSEDEAGSMQNKDKGSVYALAATNSVLANGGPESTVRLWDTKSGKRITKLVGHTDNIRDVLVSEDGHTIMTASSDRTVKVWSVTAGRCMYTLTMHDSSVWSLFSTDPQLSIFYSTDRQGLVAKTDTRGTVELDEGLSVAVCQEHEGVHSMIASGGNIWTATSRPSINRWADVNTEDAEIELPENYKMHRASISTASKARIPSPPPPRGSTSSPPPTGINGEKSRKIPLKHMLRLSNTAYFPTPIMSPDADSSTSPELVVSQPVHSTPVHAIEGQNGLIKHVMLNDRKRILTTDTAGEVMMWDLLKCVPIKSFGKRHLEDVKDEVTTAATVANWCSVDTRTGSVTVVLDDNTAFDAEMYVDELDLDDDIEFREDQRINLGKWVLRYLFSNLITEQIRRDQVFRRELLKKKEEQQRLQRENAPTSIQLPGAGTNGWNEAASGPPSANTVRQGPWSNGGKPTTPGLAIGLATPNVSTFSSPVRTSAGANALSSTAEEGAPLEKRVSQQSSLPSGQPRPSTDRNSDYFSANRNPINDSKSPATPSEADGATTPSGGDASETKETPSKFGKKFRMNMSFKNMSKSLSRTSDSTSKDTTSNPKPAAVEETKEEAESDSHSTQTSNSRSTEDNLLGVVQKLRFAYEDSLQAQLQNSQAFDNGLPVPEPGPIDIPSSINPSLPAETPVLKPPLHTTILIQEDRPEAGGVADLFEGTVGALGLPETTDRVEKVAPAWLGEVLLRNQVPAKDIVKISFVLEPMAGSGLPSIAADGNNRLNANRMLRARKILGYVAERVEPGYTDEVRERDRAEGKEVLRVEEYLELWCQGQVVPPTMTLATMRAHLWRGGGDIVLYYKPTGRRELSMRAPPPPPPQAPAGPQVQPLNPLTATSSGPSTGPGMNAAEARIAGMQGDGNSNNSGTVEQQQQQPPQAQ
ncbi:hypothetical protein MBLNU230_g2327t1 [Neophaeotheca triangularis]